MFHVWTPEMKVASASTLGQAMHYALQYLDEGEVIVRDGRKVVATLSRPLSKVVGEMFARQQPLDAEASQAIFSDLDGLYEP